MWQEASSPSSLEPLWPPSSKSSTFSQSGSGRREERSVKQVITTLKVETYLFNWQENEDKDTTFDLKDADYDDDDYKGDIKSKDYEEDKLQNVETIQNSPPATSPDSFGKVTTIDFQQSSTKKISRLEAARKLRPHTGDLELQHLPGLLATLHQSCLDSFCFVLFMTTG